MLKYWPASSPIYKQGYKAMDALAIMIAAPGALSFLVQYSMHQLENNVACLCFNYMKVNTDVEKEPPIV